MALKVRGFNQKPENEKATDFVFIYPSRRIVQER